MKNKLIYILLVFFLAICCSSFAAILYKANEIEFISSFTDETTVEGALNELFKESNVPLKTLVLNNKSSSNVSEKFTTSKNGTAKIICVRGSSNTTVSVMKDGVEIFSNTSTEQANVMREIGSVDLIANTEYEFILKGLGNPSTNASAIIVYY